MAGRTQGMNLTRRIKMHLLGPPQDYFAVTAPGIEDLCLRELKAPPLAVTAAERLPGGVAFRGRLHQLYGANLHLRTATRILLRLARLEARSFGKLEAQVAELPWELYLPWRTMPRMQAALHKCRLYHSGAVAQRVSRAIASRWRKMAQAEPVSSRSRLPFDSSFRFFGRLLDCEFRSHQLQNRR